jgi:hypothetical protein
MKDKLNISEERYDEIMDLSSKTAEIVISFINTHGNFSAVEKFMISQFCSTCLLRKCTRNIEEALGIVNFTGDLVKKKLHKNEELNNA